MPRLTGFPVVPIPGPRPVPLLGHIPRVFQFLSDPVKAVTELRRRGDVVSVSEGSPALVCVFGAERNPERYPDPERFNPSRWEGGAEPSVYEYMPFGAGPRICVGALFAQQALRLILPTILQRARVAVQRDADISRLTRANILMPRRGVPVRVDRPHRRRLTPEPIRGDVLEMVTLS